MKFNSHISGFLKSSLLIFFFSNIGLSFNFLTQFFLIRKLAHSTYGEFTAITGIAPAYLSIIGVVPFIVSKIYFLEPEEKEYFLPRFLFGCFAIFVIIYLVFSFEILSSIDKNKEEINILLSYNLTIFCNNIFSIFYGILFAEGLFLKLVIKDAAIIVFRFFYILFFLYFNIDFLSYIFLTDILLTTSIFIYIYLKNNEKFRGIKIKFGENQIKKTSFVFFLQSLPIAINLGMIGFLTNIDIQLVKAKMSTELLGTYSIYATLAKVNIFLPSALVNIVYPIVLGGKEKNIHWKTHFIVVFILTIFSISAYSIFLFFFGSEISNIILGYEEGQNSIFFFLSILYGIVSLITILSQKLIAQEKLLYLIIILPVLLVGFHLLKNEDFNSIVDFIKSYFEYLSLSLVIILIFNLINFFWDEKKIFESKSL